MLADTQSQVYLSNRTHGLMLNLVLISTSIFIFFFTFDLLLIVVADSNSDHHKLLNIT